MLQPGWEINREERYNRGLLNSQWSEECAYKLSIPFTDTESKRMTYYQNKQQKQKTTLKKDGRKGNITCLT